MPRVQGLTELFISGDTLVKTGHGYIFSAEISWSGGSAGATVNFFDGLVAGVTPLVPFVMDSANNTKQLHWPNGKEFNTGLFIDIQSGGQVQIALQYK